MKLDSLGPVVVGKDGAVSHIANWGGMTSAEQEKTLVFVAERNKERLRALQDNLAA